MRLLLLIFKFEWIYFRRNPFQIIFVFLIFILGVFSIIYGRSEIQEQLLTIVEVEKDHKENIRTILTVFGVDTTDTKGKEKFRFSIDPSFARSRQTYPAVWKPSPFASLSIGQRDLHAYYHNLSGMALYYQLFQNEIANPQKLLAGNLDLSFILVYIFPLLIIGFTYSIFSGEKDKGVLQLLKIQAVSVKAVIIYRLLFYFLLIFSIASILSIIGFMVSGVSFSLDFAIILLWLANIFIYFFFWFSLIFLIVSLNKSSEFNATASIGLWLVFLIIVPGVLNVIVQTVRPVNSAFLTDITRRIGISNDENEESYALVLKEYLKDHPEYNTGENAFTENLAGKAFAAFHDMNDKKYSLLVDDYQQQVVAREEWANSFEFLNPAVSTQHNFNALAATDFDAYLQYYHSLLPFHKEILKFYYDRIFFDKVMAKEDYLDAPKYQEKSIEIDKPNIAKKLLLLLGIAIALFSGAYVSFTKALQR